jgi:hypothetical protein
MRANVNLDTDAYTFASMYASAKGLPLGAAISELLRRAEAASEAPTSKLTTNRRGLLVKAGAGRVVTPEMVKTLAEDDLG